MSEPTTEADATATDAEAAPATTAPAATPETEAPKPTETVEFWRAKAREQEGRAKSNAEAARRLADIEDQQKTEAQRLADRQSQIERERDEARAESLRYRVAVTHKIGEDFFDLLGTGSEDEITARAERLGPLVSAAAENEQLKAELEALRAGKPAPASGRPAPALRPGATQVDIKPPEDDSYPAHWLPQRT